MADIRDVDTDFYELLAIDTHATNKDIQKAFRQQAVKYHPDKNPTQEAAVRFHLLTVAVDCLLDGELRHKYDKLRQQKLAAQIRREQIDGERKLWIDELEKAENQVPGSDSTSDLTRKRKREEALSLEEMLAREGAQLRADLLEKLQNKVAKTEEIGKSHLGMHKHDSSVRCKREISSRNRTLKVRFRARNASSETLKSIFQHFGPVVEVVLRHGEQKVQSALIEFAHASDADRAVRTPVTLLPGCSEIDIRRLNLAEVSVSVENTCIDGGSAIVPEQTNRQEHVPSQFDSHFDKALHIASDNGKRSVEAYENHILTKMKIKQRQREREQQSRS